MLLFLYFLDMDPNHQGGHVTKHRGSPLHRGLDDGGASGKKAMERLFVVPAKPGVPPSQGS